MIWCPVLWLLGWSALLHKWSVWRRISEPVVKFGLWGRQADRSAQCRAFAGSLGFFCLGIVYWRDSMIAAATHQSFAHLQYLAYLVIEISQRFIPRGPLTPWEKFSLPTFRLITKKQKNRWRVFMYNVPGLWHDWLVASRIACVIFKYPDLHALWIRRLVSSDH